MTARPSFIVLCPLSVVLCPVFQATDNGHRTEDKGPVFVLETAAGATYRGPLLHLSEKWSVRLGGKPRVQRLAEEWLTLRRADGPLPAFPKAAHLVLTNGDRLPVGTATLKLTGEHLTFTHPLLSRGRVTRLPLSAVALLGLTAPDGTDAGRFWRQLLTRRRHDAAVLRNGDVLEGVLIALDGKELLIEAAKKKVPVGLAKVAAVVLSNDLAANLKPPEPHARVVLADGTRLTLKSAACDGETLTGTTAFEADFRVPLEQMAALDLGQPRFVYLSDLKPLRYVHTPYLGVKWPLAVDASVAGGDLRLAGGVFDKGLGMHSASRVCYALPPGSKRFEALVGLDDRTGRRGSVHLRVLLDGKERDLGLKGDLAHRTGPLRVRIDLAGAKELMLSVDFGSGGDVGDHVDWADARLIK